MENHAIDENRHRSWEFLGVRVHAMTQSELLEAIKGCVESGATNNIIGNHNLHSLYLFQRSAPMRQFYDRNLLTYLDGMSLVLLARILAVPLERVHRVAALDWFEDFLQMAEERSWRIYFLSGAPEVANKLPVYFQARYPKIRLRSHHGYDAFSPTTTVFKEIAEFAPHILLVGMGMPLQERWIVESLDRIKVNLISTIGATMDYYLGAQKPTPRWLGQLGLEWLYRLVHNPRRLFFRYIIEPITLVPFLFREWYRLKSEVGR
jgi:N-acetylglucosaminyldiphosphoundecaprenol N-acetyl-beta-D-mannosaminyltransferase